MKLKKNSGWGKSGVIIVVFLMMACSLIPNLSPTPNSSQLPIEPSTPTPTPTIIGVGVSNRCNGLSGELEMMVIVGPAEAVGLEPFAVGEIPFTVVSDGEFYIVQGGGPLSYHDVLGATWGTYTVSLDMETTVEGECVGIEGSEVLNIAVEMSGEQMVEVRADGFQGDYPWAGTQELDLSFPLEDGAMAEGTGWAFVLHLNQ